MELKDTHMDAYLHILRKRQRYYSTVYGLRINIQDSQFYSWLLNDWERLMGICARLMDLERLDELNKGEDIINRLPDEVLTHILSCLETKEAIKTCVLSSRWKNLWTLIHNLHFDDWDHEFRESPNFRNFVDKILGHCQSKDIQDFSINCSISDDDIILSRITVWICFAIERKVRNLDINLSIDEEGEQLVRLPQSILTCKTLVNLKLCSGSCDFVFDIPDFVVCLPSLKILCIEVVYPNSNLMQKLFRSCTKLEELTIHGDLELNENVLTFDIIVPTLKTLKIYLLPNWKVKNIVSIHKFVVRARNLEQIYIDDDTLSCIVMDETPLLSDASLVGCFTLLSKIEPSKNEVNRAMELLRAIKNTKYLTLSEGIMGVLVLAFDGTLPTFPNLIQLESIIDASFGWKLLPHFLNNSPNLEVLTLSKEVNRDVPLDRFSYFESENVPSCLLFRVKKIKVMCMMGDLDELEVVRYLLKNSKVLERFWVFFMNKIDSKIKMYLQHQISKFPRGSYLCKVGFC
ncbi:hypothetical protein LWI28_001556 [Acer negundo]|uniref:F-box domain-containing protein n=1 Tax=Acer negundo TaxID=4023 RepID=A0AAD5NG00_ACENE|nr:hypothetical protein LWI28_001556 [Acer negundo]